MFVRQSLLSKIGLKNISPDNIKEIKRQKYVCVSCIDGVDININYSLLTADIHVPAEYFEKREIKIAKNEEKPVESLGLFIDYDFMYSGSTSSYEYFKGFLDLNIFFGKNIFNNAVLFTYTNNQKKLIRTSTTLTIEDLDNIRRIQIGDVYTQNSQWNSTLRVGGIRIATDFSMRPDLITYPLPEFAGETALPSSVDIFIENTKVFSQDLKPGPFEIKNIPVISPEGNIRVVIKDALGRERIVEIPYLTDRKLLRKGLAEYSFTAGFTRKNYITESFKYHKFVSMGMYKFGYSDRLTLEFEAFLDGYDKGNIGFSPYILLEKIGLVTPVLALSYDGSNTGYLYGFDYSKYFDYLSFRFTVRENSEDFVQPGTVIGLPKRYYNSAITFNYTPIGNIVLSYLKREYIDTTDSEIYNISYNRRLFNILSFNASYNKYKTGNNSYDSYSMALSMPLGANHSASLRTQRNRNDQTYSLQITKSVASSKGFGYSLSATKADGSQNYTGRLKYNSEYTTMYTDFSHSNATGTSITSYRLGLLGSFIYIDGNTFFRRSVNNGFALVKIEPPVKGVVITANNTKIGETDKNGVLFVPNIHPYYKNEIKIDPSSLDMKTHIDKTIYSFVPLRKHGYLLKFKSRKINSVRLKIKFPNGKFPDPGLRFDIDDKINAGIIGYEGKAFIENITAGKHIITVDYGYGICSFELNIKEEWLDKVVPFIGEYTCIPQTGTMIAKEKKKIKVKPAKLKKDKKGEEKLKKFKRVSFEKPLQKKNIIKQNKNTRSEIKSRSAIKEKENKRNKEKEHKAYTIEVGRFSENEIKKAVEEYEEFQTKVVKEGEIYKIYIGKFKSKKDAENFMNIFKLKGKITAVRE
ncbi:fimbria/pilus outer membrane usher protein [Persephonella sp.]